MIDCENEVYTRLAKILREKFPKIDIASEYVSGRIYKDPFFFSSCEYYPE